MFGEKLLFDPKFPILKNPPPNPKGPEDGFGLWF
jgi:hypothetical protein